VSFEPTMEEEGALCQTCFAGTLQLTAGILVCETCGVTQQVLKIEYFSRVCFLGGSRMGYWV
jgi:hypothetical protein